ncbi:MAG: lactate utilization protein, partial [Candidatus Cloacimonadota bacterium]
KSIKTMHGNFHFAKDKDEALKILKGITGTGKTIVKGKSITSEEIDMNENLEQWGNTVYETDLGEFIVQSLHSRPMHILAPAVNIPKEKVAELFSKIANRDLPPDPEKLTEFAREYLRDKFVNADIGISGANAITADTGSVFLFENEGNIRFATNAPDVHIVFSGIEKILPTLSDGFRLLEVVSRYAGYLAMTYVSIVSGPSKTGDIEKTIVYGAHGPREFHVILYDSGRSEVAKDPVLSPILICVRCGACMYECAVYPITTGYWGYKYMGGIGIPWTAYISGGFEKAAPMAFTCTLCGRCVSYCPMEIDTPEIVLRLRETLNEKGYIPPFIKSMVETVMRDGVPY